ncbi:putative membrane protein [Bacillus pakistanensis]|uniref:Membrane protein n=1 Tax=Rossellomorea pakistanensis TaxID=992288 RepID=A0ABS2NGM7_9BACI|nr:small multi-drug export protein [Bacillus pakistanensis]MBM7587017.1 putative membrane protein [Bacillus pakistanensis]
MDIIWAYIMIFLLAATPLLEIIGIVPLGIVSGLSPIPVALAAFLGNLITVLFVIFLVDKVKGYLLKRKKKKQMAAEGIVSSSNEEVIETKRSKRANKLWNQYGLPGLTIIGPLIVGSHIAAFMSMSFGAKRKWVTGWMIASLTLWTVITTVATYYGLGLFVSTDEYKGFLTDLIEKE